MKYLLIPAVLIALSAPASADTDVPLVRARLGSNSLRFQDASYPGLQFGAQLHPTLGKSGSTHLDRAFVGYRAAVSPGDFRELSRHGAIVGYQSPDLSGGATKHLGISTSAGLSLERYDVYVESLEDDEFEGKSFAQGLVLQLQVTLWRIEVGVGGELAYVFAAEELSHNWGITLGFTAF